MRSARPPSPSAQPHYLRRPSRWVRVLRRLRPLHRYTGIALALLIVISSATGVLLGWKKNSELLQPPTHRGVSTELAAWRPLHEIQTEAQRALAVHLSAPDPAALRVDRFDARPDRGIVKVLFAEGYWEVQVDATTAQARSVARRHSDWIEKLHDGSIIGDGFKLVSMNLLGLSLLFLTATGLLLWYGPRRLRRGHG